MDLKDVTIIVPTKNERTNIISFLQSIPEQIPLIVVDASTDGTAELVRKMRSSSTTILREKSNIARSRQAGSEVAQTEWLLFTDADVVFCENYFDYLSRLQLKSGVAGIVGTKRSLDRYRFYFHLFSAWLKFICFLNIPAATGSNMLVRRSALFEAGGFDISLPCNEDSFLMWQISRLGYQVHYNGSLVVYETDHRRLDRGVVLKTIHSIVRCILLFSGCLSPSLRYSDWGYWSKHRTNTEIG